MAMAQKSMASLGVSGIFGLNGEVVGDVLNGSEGTFMARDSRTGLTSFSRTDG